MTVDALWGSSDLMWGTDGSAESVLFPEYHVVLGGRGLLLTRGGWERRLGQAYAAKLSTSGTTQNDRLRDELLLLDNWNGGEGYLRFEPDTPDRYRRGSGIDPYTEEGAVALGPYMGLEWGSALNGLTKLGSGSGELFIGTSAGLIYTHSGSGTPTLDYTTGKAGGIKSLTRAYADIMYAGTGTDGVVFSHSLSGGWTSAFTLSGTVTSVTSIRAHWKDGTQYLYLGADNSNNRCTIHTWDGATAAAYSTAVLGEPVCSVMLNYGTDLLMVGVDSVARASGVYTIDDSGAKNTGFSKLFYQEGAVILCGAVLGNYAYFGDKYKGRIWRWDGDRLKLYHQLGTDAVPYTAEIRGMVAWQDGLWITIVDTDGTIGLLRFDGNQSWTRPVTGLSGTTPEDVCEFAGDLYMLTSATGASKLRATDGTFGGSGYVESGLIDARLSGTDKQWRGVTVRHSALAATQSVEVQYKLEDSGSWVSLGTSSTDGETSTDFDFPSAISADLIAFKLILTGTAGSSSALKVYSLSARYVPSPGATREWSMTVDLRGTSNARMKLLDGTYETDTGEEISADVWALVDALSPVVFYDIDRQAYEVRIAEWRESMAPNSAQIDAMDVGWDLQGSLRLTEV